MTCDLSKEELAVLYALHRHHCFNDKASYNLKQIASGFRMEYGKDANDVAKCLAKKRICGPKKEKRYKVLYLRHQSRSFCSSSSRL
jgi:hypothetical protein